MIVQVAAVAVILALGYEGLVRHWSDFKGKTAIDRKPPLPPQPPPKDLPSVVVDTEVVVRRCATPHGSPVVPDYDPNRQPPLAYGAGNMGLDQDIPPEIIALSETIIMAQTPDANDQAKLIALAKSSCDNGWPILAGVIMSKVDWLRIGGKAPAKPGDLPAPQPLPKMPDVPPAIDLGAVPGMAAFGGPAPYPGSIEEYQVRRTLAWEVDAAALDRWITTSRVMGWTKVTSLFLAKMKGVIANPQPYAYLQTEYPNYMVSTADGVSTPIALDTPDDQSTGIAKYLLANELDMGNLANAASFYATKGYPYTASMFAKKLKAQMNVRNAIGAPLPTLVMNTDTGRIQSTSIQPMPNPVKLFNSPVFAAAVRGHRRHHLGR